MSAETAPTEFPANKAEAIVDLDQQAMYSDMTNEQYDTTRASIDAAHNVIAEDTETEKKTERPIANAAALLAIHQAAAANNWDADRIQLAEQELQRKTAAK